MHITPQELSQLDRVATERVLHDAFLEAHPEYCSRAPESAERVAARAVDHQLHPLFANILARHSALPFRSRVGDHRSFATSTEAVAFERGVNEFLRDQTEPPGLPSGPRYEGYTWAKAQTQAAPAVVPHRRAVEAV